MLRKLQLKFLRCEGCVRKIQNVAVRYMIAPNSKPVYYITNPKQSKKNEAESFSYSR